MKTGSPNSPLGMRKEWRRFLEELGRPVEFLHRDELRERYGVEDELPAVFERNGDDLTPWMGAQELNGCESLESLQAAIRARLRS